VSYGGCTLGKGDQDIDLILQNCDYIGVTRAKASGRHALGSPNFGGVGPDLL
jgi:hypothetical protein